MRAKCSAFLLSFNHKSFVDKETGKRIEYARAKFSVRDSEETFTLAVPPNFDSALLVPYTDVYLLVNFHFEEKYGSFKGRLLNTYPDAKSMASASMQSQSEVLDTNSVSR